ncbi:MAG: hypothetical protein FWF11_03830, partial [Coriobacteriia bacterium]|nr:hypothetical protein [Coriobacteriia bacterium]
SKFTLLIAAIFLLMVPILAVANSAALQSILQPVQAAFQPVITSADDGFVPNEAPAVVSGGISPFSSAGIMPEATTFAAGGAHSLAIRADGTLWSWGGNTFGATGLGTDFDEQLIPAQVGSDADWVSVTAGDFHSLAIKSDGTLWAWGDNDWGAAGLGDTVNAQLVPAQVGSDTDWVLVSTGNTTSHAIKADGTLWSWGEARSGRAGIDTTEIVQYVPVQVGSDTDWAAVSAGGNHSIALKTDGTLWSWGNNQFGATGIVGLPIGTSLDAAQWTPAQVSSDTNWASVSAGWQHSLALKSDGTLWSWGWNSGGRTGLGTYTGNQLTPAQVGTATNWRQVSASNAAALALAADGTIWSWGWNEFGVTGLGAGMGNTIVPTQVGTATDWVEVSSAQYCHFLGMKTNGNLWGWGGNWVGQVGLGNMIDRLTPALIWEPLFTESITPQGSGVAITTESMVITFSHAVNRATAIVVLNGTLLDLTTATWTEGDTVLTIPLAGLLDYATRYEVEGEFEAANPGNVLPMAEPLLHQFVTEPRDLDLAITKNLLMPEGTVAPDTNFIFNIDAYSLNGETATASLAYMPTLSVDPVAFSSTDMGTVDGDTITITRISDFLLGNDLPFPFAGVYVYRISEADDTFTNTDTETMTFDPTVYQITFQVENLPSPSPANSLFVRAIFLQLVVDGVPGPKIDITDNLEDALTFTNIFIRDHDNDDPLDPSVAAGLRISKEVAGVMANQMRLFDFELSVQVPSLLTTLTGYRAYVVETIAGVPTVVTTADNGTIAGTSDSGAYLFFSSTATQTVSLRHGQTLVFAGTHVGTRYSVTEQAAANYTPSVAVATNGLPVVVAPADMPNTALTVPVQILGEAANRAAFTNTHSATIEAGLDVGNFGSALLLMTIVGLIVMVTATRRGRRDVQLQVLTH